jgi:DNA helicase-2/ATP-dependent DNA helicase PcrA
MIITMAADDVFTSRLNDEQRAAVTAPDGSMLVLAAAGTGKTRTLVYRVAYLVQNGVKPGNILLLTFTNKAAREMLDRARDLVGPEIGGIWAGTFHHMANRILRRHADLLGYPRDYVILDRDDSLKMVTDCIKSRGLDSKEFPKPRVLLSLFSAACNKGESLDEILELKLPDSVSQKPEIKGVYRDYEARKRKSSAMDFDDLLCKCLELLAGNSEVLERYRDRFRHILVDEYQDTNVVQSRLIDLLAKGSTNLFVVGDDFQSIYSWRGADFRHMLTFPDRYGGAQTFKLETNYRSSPEVLELANACIEVNSEQFKKRLRATRDNHRKPRLIKVRDGAEQARRILCQLNLLRREGYAYSDIAVLYRSHYHAMELQMQLSREDVPFVITSGIRFFEQAHVKDCCTVLRMLYNPSDEPAFMRLMTLLPGIGRVKASKLWQAHEGRVDFKDPSLLEGFEGELPKAAVAHWKQIRPVLEAVADEDLYDCPGEVIQRFIDFWYEDYCFRAFEDPERRLDDIREMISFTGQFENLQAFLSEVALITSLETEETRADAENRDALRLSTIHQAKGLEWSVVIIPWLVEGMFPSARSIDESEHADAEERRLFYVAVTRARDEVCFFVPEMRRRRDGGVMSLQPSRFLSEIPPGLLDEEYPGFV